MAFDPSTATEFNPDTVSFDPETAVPVERRKAETPSTLDVLSTVGPTAPLIGGADAALTLGTSAVAAPVAGITGMGAALAKALGITDADPGELVKAVQDYITHKPATKGGKEMISAASYPFEKLAEAGTAVGDKTLAATNSPFLAAAADTTIQALPMIVSKLASKLPASKGANLSHDVQALNEAGVKLTPGQIIGGAAQRAEDALTSIPIAGDAIKGAQRAGHESFNRAVANKALDPVGETLPKGYIGHNAVEYVQNTLGEKYDALLGKMKGSLDGPIQPDNAPLALPPPGGAPATLRAELSNIMQLGESLPEPQAGQLSRIIQREVIDRFTKDGRASGETLKNIESKLGKMATKMARSDDYDIQTLGTGIEETQNALRRMLARENPAYAEELSKINDGYAIFKRMQAASSYVNAKDGVFTPSQLYAAIRAADKSKDHSAFAKGDALLQDFAGAGKNVLSPTVPDSGTVTRALMSLANPKVLAAAVPTVPLYSGVAQRAAQSMLTRGPGTQIPDVSSLMAAATPLGEKERRRRELLQFASDNQ